MNDDDRPVRGTTLTDAVVVVTGGASGIGAALCRRFAAAGARAVVVADQDEAGAISVASTLGPAGLARRCDVTVAADCDALIAAVEAEVGPVDLLCSNAGIASGGRIETPDDVWNRVWAVNVMGTVHLVRAWLPSVRARRRGTLVVTASAAGLLTNLGDAPYTATKHAAVGLAEWLAITHGDEGLRVHCLCPQGVRTPMVTDGLAAGELGAAVVDAMGLIEPEQVAETVLEAVAGDGFLILPHPEVADYRRLKAGEPDRWLAGMRSLQRRLTGG